MVSWKPNFLYTAMKTNVKFRRGLPLGCLNHFGLIHSARKLSMKKRAKFHADCHRLLDELLGESVPIQMNANVDLMAQKFVHGALPSMLTAEETLPALEMLFTTYPQFTSIDSLPLATIEDKITFASTLYEKGLIRTGTFG